MRKMSVRAVKTPARRSVHMFPNFISYPLMTLSSRLAYLNTRAIRDALNTTYDELLK